jgi:hypothetical protein
MISCRITHLEQRCRQRGYTLDEVRPCIVSEDGDQITVDIDHPAYPKAPKPGFLHPKKVPPAHAATPASGPGTELKALLKRVGIVASPGCSCNTRAKLMDEQELKEPGWCEKNLETICDWLQEEATKRKLPFLRMAGKILVRKAIRNARKKGQ